MPQRHTPPIFAPVVLNPTFQKTTFGLKPGTRERSGSIWRVPGGHGGDRSGWRKNNPLPATWIAMASRVHREDLESQRRPWRTLPVAGCYGAGRRSWIGRKLHPRCDESDVRAFRFLGFGCLSRIESAVEKLILGRSNCTLSVCLLSTIAQRKARDAKSTKAHSFKTADA
jgi:hypothetical protein